MNDKPKPVIDTIAVAGETPVWDPEKELLYWTDFLGGKIFIFDPVSNNSRSIDVGLKVGTIVTRESGGAIVALENGFSNLDLETGEMTHILDPEPDKTNNRLNDGKCDSEGRLWISSVSQNFEKGTATMDPLGKFYCLATDLKVRVVLDSVVQVNGMGWSLDNQTMFLVDTVDFKILAFDYDSKQGSISNKRFAVEVPEDFGYPDGMCIDADENIWLAHWGGHQITKWDPGKGKLLERIPVPSPNVTCCTFGGPGLDELYITTAGFGLSDEEWAKYPDSGKLFKYIPGTKGLKAYSFKG